MQVHKRAIDNQPLDCNVVRHLAISLIDASPDLVDASPDLNDASPDLTDASPDLQSTARSS